MRLSFRAKTDPDHNSPDHDSTGRSSRLLYVGPFISYVDRFALPPILVSIGRDFDSSLAGATVVATVYFFSYGVAQPAWGLLSDRVGRVRVMRWALVGLGLAELSAAAAPGLGALVVTKALTGGFASALLPTSLVYIGDTVPFARRQQVVANVLAAGAAGTVTGTMAAGLLARFATWRLVFVLPVPMALALAVALGRLPESLGAQRLVGPWGQVRQVLRHRWAVVLLALALGEGAVILGFFTFLAPALELAGQSTVVAGLVVAAYGAAVFAGTRVVKGSLQRRAVPPTRLIVAGGALLALAYVVAAVAQGVANILAANVLVGLAFALLHSTLQTWATEVAPEARGTATSLFVAAVFTGAAIGTAAVSGLADGGRYGLLFLVAAGVTVPVVIAAALARGRYQASADASAGG